MNLLYLLAILPIVYTNVPFTRKGNKSFKKEPGYPVVLVPGDGGSQLEANLTGKPSVPHYLCYKQTQDFFDLWLNLQFITTPVAFACWLDNMQLVWNNETKLAENMPGVDIRVPGFNTTETVEWLDPSKTSWGLYFFNLVDMMTSWGYKRGKNVFGAPFDWRKSPNELTDYYTELKGLIENAYRYNNNKKVVIIGHSMGNPIMLHFYNNYVDQAWKDKFIQSHVSLAAPWGGSMQIVRLFASGYNMNFYRVFLSPYALRTMQRSFTSSAFLFPNPTIWGINETLATVADKNYTLSNIEEFFKDINYEVGYEQYKRVALLNGDLRAPGVAVHCLYGTKVPTPDTFTWSSKYWFPDWAPSQISGDGDGTVNLRSAEACARWNGKNNGYPVNMHALPDTDHMKILQSPPMMEIVRQVLYDEKK